MKSRAVKSLIAAVALLGIATPAAAADGLPVPIDYTFGEGVVSADGSSRFVSISTSGRTVVMRVAVDGGEIEDYTVADGTYTIPAIAVDGTASGISADGRTLALIKPRTTFPRKVTAFLIYQASKREKVFRNRSHVRLNGDFSFDALSPDGETMYLVEYTDRRDPGAYQVRSFDLSSGQLDPEPILDTEEEPGEMRGFPQTRVTSAGGRWEYTLYDGGEHPFIHALDVVDAKTVCIDLDMIHAHQTYDAKLAMSADGGAIELTDRKGALRAVVDTATHEASEPGAEPEPAAAPAEPDEPGLAPAGIAAGALALMALAGLAIRRMRN